LALCLAALRIGRELLDLCRHYFGPHGVAANHESARIDGKMGVWKLCLWVYIAVTIGRNRAKLQQSCQLWP
jgi:hypothetical protein